MRNTREIHIGRLSIGGNQPIAVQSMCATKTTDIQATLSQIHLLESAGASLIRIAVDSHHDVEALKAIRQETEANLVVDLQESFELSKDVAPYVQKMRYNPGHLHHHKRALSVQDKVHYITQAAGSHNCAIRVGVNFGSIDPKLKEFGNTQADRALSSALEHCELLEKENFENYCVSLKSSNPDAVVDINRRFSSLMPQIPIHLGVTEAGLLPEGEIKTRRAFEKLIVQGIGDTIRVSLTLPDHEKYLEILVGYRILSDIKKGILLGDTGAYDVSDSNSLNIISCPSCSRVENSAFVKLAQKVKEATLQYRDRPITIAVMGCRVNGPGETDHADFGLWCAPNHVNFKRGQELVGQFGYDEVIDNLLSEIFSIRDCDEEKQ